jgi:hypothetical protein
MGRLSVPPALAVWDRPEFVTPPGIENSRNSTKQREDSSSPTEKPTAQIASRSLTKRSGSKVANLAAMAANALRNYDVDRALELLEQIRMTCDPEAQRPAIRGLKVVT